VWKFCPGDGLGVGVWGGELFGKGQHLKVGKGVADVRGAERGFGDFFQGWGPEAAPEALGWALSEPNRQRRVVQEHPKKAGGALRPRELKWISFWPG